MRVKPIISRRCGLALKKAPFITPSIKRLIHKPIHKKTENIVSAFLDGDNINHSLGMNVNVQSEKGGAVYAALWLQSDEYAHG